MNNSSNSNSNNVNQTPQNKFPRVTNYSQKTDSGTSSIPHGEPSRNISGSIPNNLGPNNGSQAALGSKSNNKKSSKLPGLDNQLDKDKENNESNKDRQNKNENESSNKPISDNDSINTSPDNKIDKNEESNNNANTGNKNTNNNINASNNTDNNPPEFSNRNPLNKDDENSFHKEGLNNPNSTLAKPGLNNPEKEKQALGDHLNESTDNNEENSKKNNGTTGGSITDNLFALSPKMKRRLIIGGIAAGVFLLFVVFLLLLSSMISVYENSDMCEDESENGSSGTYTGSKDTLEFLCKMGNPFGDKYNFNVTCPVDDQVFHKDHKHQGIDIGCAAGTPIYAVQDAKVVKTGNDSGRGNYVFLDHGDGFGTVYQHLTSINVETGDKITKGKEVGTCGNTGNSYGSHLHFELNTNPTNPWNHYLPDINSFFGPQTYATTIETAIKSFRKNCGSTVNEESSGNFDDKEITISTQKKYKNIKVLKTLSNNTGRTVAIRNSGYNPQSFAYNNGYYYVQWIRPGATGSGGLIYKYNENIKQESKSPSVIETVGHGNGLTYYTKDKMLYSVTTSRVGPDNTKATVISAKKLKYKKKVSLGHGTSGIAYDRLTDRFITSSGAADANSSSTGYLYVYNSDLSKQVGAKSIPKKRWNVAGDIAAYGGIIYVCVHSSTGNNHIDMYNEENGDYLGSYDAPYNEIESIDIDGNGQIVLLFHGPDFIQFTGIKANVIEGTSDSDSESSSNQCCTNSSVTISTSSESGEEYCPDGIIVKGSGTYDLEDYVAGVISAENSYEKNGKIEASKANAVAARTYALYNTNNCKNPIDNSQGAQVFKSPEKIGKKAAKETAGQVMLYNGKLFSSEYDAFCINDEECSDSKCNGDSCTVAYLRKPSQTRQNITLRKGSSGYESVISGTYNNKGHARGMSQLVARQMQDEGKTYTEILEYFYADGITITGATSSSNSCSLGGNGSFKGGKLWNYNQADYNAPYCGETIATGGCGPTAMAMVVSTFLQEKHDPEELGKISEETGNCSTLTSAYFTDAAKKYGLDYKITKDDDEVLTALNRGDSLVIVNVGTALNNYWTSYGHYILLAGHSGDDVWVNDPNKSTSGTYRSNTNGDGVYSFEKYIKPAAVNFKYIIFTKK